MPFLTSGPGTGLYYEDRGAGTPVILLAGCPMDLASWDQQTTALLDAGHRVIVFDRRGYGRSSRSPAYSLDVWADDVHHLVAALELHGGALIGYSLGAIETLRYIRRHGPVRVDRVALIAGPIPGLARGAENPDGLDPDYFDAVDAAVAEDRFAFLDGFFRNCFTAEAGAPPGISEPALQAFLQVAFAADPFALRACGGLLRQDFRQDLAGLSVPVLVLHGDQDRIAPLALTFRRAAALLPQARLEIIAGAPHGLLWTHAKEVNRALLAFLSNRSQSSHSSASYS